MFLFASQTFFGCTTNLDFYIVEQVCCFKVSSICHSIDVNCLVVCWHKRGTTLVRSGFCGGKCIRFSAQYDNTIFRDRIFINGFKGLEMAKKCFIRERRGRNFCLTDFNILSRVQHSFIKTDRWRICKSVKGCIWNYP